jgi:hypothetical protein
VNRRNTFFNVDIALKPPLYTIISDFCSLAIISALLCKFIAVEMSKWYHFISHNTLVCIFYIFPDILSTAMVSLIAMLSPTLWADKKGAPIIYHPEKSYPEKYGGSA